jgi:hypothetical protein
LEKFQFGRFVVLRFSNLEPGTSKGRTAEGFSFGEGSRCRGSRCPADSQPRTPNIEPMHRR